MENIGFLLPGCILAFFTATWVFMLFFDGAFGKRGIPLVAMFASLAFIVYLWSLLIKYSPFAITVI